MLVDIGPTKFENVVQLVANPSGFAHSQTNYHMDRQKTDFVDPRKWELKDWETNELKPAVKAIIYQDECLTTDVGLTDYRTLRSVPHLRTEEFLLHQHERTVNRSLAPNANFEAALPWGIAIHNVLVNQSEVFLMRRGTRVGSFGGAVSVTAGEQMDPSRDEDPFLASQRGFHEELGLKIGIDAIRLLAVGAEDNTAYAAYVFVAKTDLTAPQIAESWESAEDFKEHTDLFAVPFSQTREWNGSDISAQVWLPSRVSGRSSSVDVLKTHQLATWILGLTNRFVIHN